MEELLTFGQRWTYDTDCTSDDSNIKFYVPSASDTSKQIEHSSWSAGYGNGAFMKNLSSIYTDTVKFGTVSLQNQAIGRPQEACSTAKGQVTQGLIGLGYGSWPNGERWSQRIPSCVTLTMLNIAAHPPQNTFFTDLAPTLKMPLFTVSLNYRNPGFYDFGFVDKRKYSGPLRYFPVPTLPTQSLWGVNATGYAVGDNQSLKPFDGGNLPTFIDSGGAFIFLPPKYCDEYYAQASFAEPANVDINHNGNPMATHIFPCSETLPDLVIAVGDYQTTIPGLLLQGSQYNATSKCTHIAMQEDGRFFLLGGADFITSVRFESDSQWRRVDTLIGGFVWSPLSSDHVRGVSERAKRWTFGGSSAKAHSAVIRRRSEEQLI